MFNVYSNVELLMLLLVFYPGYNFPRKNLNHSILLTYLIGRCY